jgi:hypothetical protein
MLQFIEKLKAKFIWTRSNSDNNKAVAKTKNGQATSIIGNGNAVNIGITTKQLAMRDVKAAIGDLDYNANTRSKPFKYRNIEQILALLAPYELNLELHDELSEYLRKVGIYNNYEVWNYQPVISQSKILKEQLQEHLMLVSSLE